MRAALYVIDSQWWVGMHLQERLQYLNVIKLFENTQANMSPAGLCVALFREMGEPGKEAEHAEAEAKKREDLERRFAEAQASSSHSYLVQVCGTVL